MTFDAPASLAERHRIRLRVTWIVDDSEPKSVSFLSSKSYGTNQQSSKAVKQWWNLRLEHFRAQRGGQNGGMQE